VQSTWSLKSPLPPTATEGHAAGPDRKPTHRQARFRKGSGTMASPMTATRSTPRACARWSSW
jgi:hypothetical protein